MKKYPIKHKPILIIGIAMLLLSPLIGIFGGHVMAMLTCNESMSNGYFGCDPNRLYDGLLLVFLSLVVGFALILYAVMTKQKIKTRQKGIIAIIVGLIVIAVTPVIQELINYFLTKDCPFVWGKVECGLSKGLQNANIVMAVEFIWVFTGIVILLVGLLSYFNTNKR